MLHIDIIIPTYNHLEDCLKRCLQSIIKSTTFSREDRFVRVIVSSNGSTDGTQEYVRSLGPCFKLIDHPEPLGYPRAVNAALKISMIEKADYVILLNNDAEVLTHSWPKDCWIDYLLAPFKTDPMMGITGPHRHYCNVSQVEFMIFYCVMISRQCLEEVGLLDEGMGWGGGEDIDFAAQASLKGFRMAQVPDEGLSYDGGPTLVSHFPLWHVGEATVFEVPGWAEHIDRNREIIRKRYAKPKENKLLTHHDIGGWQSDAFEAFFSEMIRRVPENAKVVELGSFVGQSACFMTQYSKKINKPIQLSCVDHFKGDPFLVNEFSTRNIKQEFLDNMRGAEVIDMINLVEKSTTGAVNDFENESLDMCFIDANHTYEAAAEDIKNWLPKVKKNGILCGDDYLFDGVKKAVDELPFRDQIRFIGRYWYYDMGRPAPIEVTCVIPTRKRFFTTLPIAIQCVINQTVKPKCIIIYDDNVDGEKLDPNVDPLYKHLMTSLAFHGIEWHWEWVNGQGLVKNHLLSVKQAPTQWIWRLDDDNAPEPDCLERLVKQIKSGVGGVAGAIYQASAIRPLNSIASNKIEDIYLGINEQWYIHPDNREPYEVDHFYSSFLYRKDLAEHCGELSQVSHREDTIASHTIKRKGYKLILDPQAVTWHYTNPTGGIRTNEAERAINTAHDSEVFARLMLEWGIKPTRHEMVVLDNGLGDHFAFKSCLEDYLAKKKGRKVIVFACFPQVFEGLDVQLASIADAKDYFGKKIEEYSIYNWMVANKWHGGLPAAFRCAFELPQEDWRDGVDGSGNEIIISPWSFNPGHAKSYPHWNRLVTMIKAAGYKVIQIGRAGEAKIDADEFMFSAPFKDISDRIASSRAWISVDNFLQHMVHCMQRDPIRGIVLWGQSDPEIFGYKYNTNLLRDSKYLRPDQFGKWVHDADKPKDKDIPQIIGSFVQPEEIMKYIEKTHQK